MKNRTLRIPIPIKFNETLPESGEIIRNHWYSLQLKKITQIPLRNTQSLHLDETKT